MSIIQDLYKIFDNERARYEANASSKNAVLRELSDNLSFLREGLKEKLEPMKIISGLEKGQYTKANDSGFNFNTLQKKSLSLTTCGGIKEFERYKGWSTGKLIKNVYLRLSTLGKLISSKTDIDAGSRLMYLFKFMLLVMAHINEEQLKIKSR